MAKSFAMCIRLLHFFADASGQPQFTQQQSSEYVLWHKEDPNALSASDGRLQKTLRENEFSQEQRESAFIILALH